MEALLAFRAETRDLFSLIAAIPAKMLPVGPSALPALEAELAFEARSPRRAWQREAGLVMAAAQIHAAYNLPLGPWLDRLRPLVTGPVSREPGDTLTTDLADLLPRLQPEDRDAVLRAGASAVDGTNAHQLGGISPAFLQEFALFVAAQKFGRHANLWAARAAKSLSHFGEAVVPHLAAALPEATADGAEAFALALGRVHTASSAELLVELLGHSSKGAKAAALVSLEGLGPVAEAAVERGAASARPLIRRACEMVRRAFAQGTADRVARTLRNLAPAERTELDETLARLLASPGGDDARLAFVGSRGESLFAALFAEAQERHADYTYLARAKKLLAAAAEATPAYVPLAVAFVTQLPAVAVSAIDIFHGSPHVERALAPALAEAMRASTKGAEIANFPAQKRAFEILAAAKEDVSTEFWLEALSDARRGLRTAAAEALHGRGVVPEVARMLTERRGEVRAAAAEFLAHEKRAGAGIALRRALAREEDPALRAVMEHALREVPDGARGTRAQVSPKADDEERVPGKVLGARALLSKERRKKVPLFVAEVAKNPLRTKGGHLLDADGMLALCTRLSNEGSEMEDPVARAVRADIDDGSAERFGDDLVDAWFASGRDSKHKWCIYQLAMFGSESKIDELGTKLGAEASNGQHRFVQWCLEAFGRRGRALPRGASTGRDLALSWVAHWSGNASTEAVKRTGREVLAKERELRQDPTFEAQIDRFVAADAIDRALPNFSLSERFFVHDVDHRPTLVEGCVALTNPSGEVVPFPKRRARDDRQAGTRRTVDGTRSDSDPSQESYERVRNRFEELKARVDRMVLRETFRLEQAMITGRVWRLAAFQTLCSHPVLRPLLGRLVFRLAGTERLVTVDSDGSLSTGSERLAWDFGEPGIFLPHPATMTALEIDPWNTYMASLGAPQPFPQLAREVHLGPDALVVHGTRMKAGALAARLLESQWQHGRPDDLGLFHDSWRLFTGFDVRVTLTHGPLAISGGQSRLTELVSIKEVRFEDLFERPLCSATDPEALIAAKVPPAVRSEVGRVLHDLERAYARPPVHAESSLGDRAHAESSLGDR